MMNERKQNGGDYEGYGDAVFVDHAEEDIRDESREEDDRCTKEEGEKDERDKTYEHTKVSMRYLRFARNTKCDCKVRRSIV